MRQAAGKPNPTDQVPEEEYRAGEEKGAASKRHLSAATSRKDRQSTPLHSNGQIGIEFAFGQRSTCILGRVRTNSPKFAQEKVQQGRRKKRNQLTSWLSSCSLPPPR